MALIYCTACATQISDQAAACPNCGHPNAANRVSPVGSKSRVTAGILAILVGGIGVHKFYLDKVGLGILYLVFFWTGIPALVGLIEGIIYLTQSDADFASAQGVRVA